MNTLPRIEGFAADGGRPPRTRLVPVLAAWAALAVVWLAFGRLATMLPAEHAATGRSPVAATTPAAQGGGVAPAGSAAIVAGTRVAGAAAADDEPSATSRAQPTRP